MNYYNTLIEIADDCPATKSQVPQARGGKKTKAVVEYGKVALIAVESRDYKRLMKDPRTTKVKAFRSARA